MKRVRKWGWTHGPLDKRLKEVLSQSDFDILLEIAFCDPVDQVRATAVYHLNQLDEQKKLEVKDPACYYQQGGFDNYDISSDETDYWEYFHSSVYGYGKNWDSFKKRRDIIPYISSQELLHMIAWRDPNNWVAIDAAIRIEKIELLQKSVRNFNKEVNNCIRNLITLRKKGKKAPRALPMPEPDFIAAKRINVSDVPLSHEELQMHSKNIIKFLNISMYNNINENDIMDAFLALETLYDKDLALALKRLHDYKDFKHRLLIEEFDGIMLHDVITYDYPWQKSPALYFSLVHGLSNSPNDTLKNLLIEDISYENKNNLKI